MPATLALSARQDKYGCTGRLDVECAMIDPANTPLADWKGEACLAPRATGRTGRNDP